MKRNNRKGVSLMALVCTIVIMLVLAATVTVSFNQIIKSTREKEFANEVYSIQKLVDQYKFKNNKYPVYDDYEVEVDISKDKLQFLEEDSSSIFREINLYEAGVEELNRGHLTNGDDDIYIVSESTGKVYYLKGVKISNRTFYTLTDELKKKLGILK